MVAAVPREVGGARRVRGRLEAEHRALVDGRGARDRERRLLEEQRGAHGGGGARRVEGHEVGRAHAGGLERERVARHERGPHAQHHVQRQSARPHALGRRDARQLGERRIVDQDERARLVEAGHARAVGGVVEGHGELEAQGLRFKVQGLGFRV